MTGRSRRREVTDGKKDVGGIFARRRAEWTERLARFQRSGLPIGAFAAEEGVRAATLSWWRRKLELEQAQPRREPTSFVRLSPIEREPKMAVPFEVSLGNGVCVRVWPHFDASELTRLLSSICEVGR